VKFPELQPVTPSLAKTAEPAHLMPPQADDSLVLVQMDGLAQPAISPLLMDALAHHFALLESALLLPIGLQLQDHLLSVFANGDTLEIFVIGLLLLALELIARMVEDVLDFLKVRQLLVCALILGLAKIVNLTQPTSSKKMKSNKIINFHQKNKDYLF